jgi:hypothetical protein
MFAENLILLLVAVLLMGLLLFSLLQSFRLIFGYRLTETSIKVLLFDVLPIYDIPLKRIIDLHVAPMHKVALVPGYHLFRYPFGRRVVVEMRDSWVRFAFLTPNNPEEFIADVRGRIATSKNSVL